jgi:hypothetical protein
MRAGYAPKAAGGTRYLRIGVHYEHAIALKRSR